MLSSYKSCTFDEKCLNQWAEMWISDMWHATWKCFTSWMGRSEHVGIAHGHVIRTLAEVCSGRPSLLGSWAWKKQHVWKMLCVQCKIWHGRCRCRWHRCFGKAIGTSIDVIHGHSDGLLNLSLLCIPFIKGILKTFPYFIRIFINALIH